MTNEELAALLTKLDGEATPGPVEVKIAKTVDNVGGRDCAIVASVNGRPRVIAETFQRVGQDGKDDSGRYIDVHASVNAELFATYRNHHAQIVAGLAALGEVERLRAENERMRAEIHGGALVPISEWNITIAERDALKVALQPFADACTKADASSEEVRRAGMGHGHSDDATPGWGIRYKHLKAARAALQPAKEKT